MGETIFRKTARYRWIVLALWVGAVVAAVMLLPDLQNIVKHSQTKFLPSEAPSAKAEEMLKRIHPDQQSNSNAVVVLRRGSGLTARDRQWLKGKLKFFTDHKTQYGIEVIHSSLFDRSLAKQFESKDGTTMLAAIDLPKADFAAQTQSSIRKIRQALASPPNGATAKLTGSGPINVDYAATSQNGLKKSEVLTLVLVLGILLIVFRSPVAPFIPLITIGAAFAISRGLIALAAEHGLPVSNFTETFLVAVLFGAGTDYCILLIHRFREELSKDSDRVEAMVRTMLGVGKTVVFAGSTVLIAFFLIGFAKFGLYQSAVGVAIGIAVAILAGVTLAPSLMIILGPVMFWPFQVRSGSTQHESRIWRGFARLSTGRRPWLVLLIGILVMSPIALLFHGVRSFNDLAEIDPGIGSVAGFHQIEEAFSPGEALPTTVALQSKVSFRSAQGLAALEKASQAVSQMPDVDKVMSAARPLGEQIKQLTVPEELQKSNQAINQLQNGVAKVGKGLADAKQKLEGQAGSIDKLHKGLQQMADETAQSGQGLKQVSQGLDQSRKAADRLAAGLTKSSQTLTSMKSDLQQLAADHPELAQNRAYLSLAAKQEGLSKAMKPILTGEKALSDGLTGLQAPVNRIAGGLDKLAQGQKQSADGVQSLQQGIGQFGGGLSQSVDALHGIADGLGKVADAQQAIADAGGNQLPGWVLPPDQLSGNADLKRAMDAYLSAGGKSGKMIVMLSINPYSKKALALMPRIQQTVEQSLRGTPYASTVVRLSGVSAQYHDLDGISKADFYRTGIFVLIGIFIVLALLIRSILAPLYILLSLGLNYLAAMGITEFIFVKLLGYSGLSWTVPFFVFVVIVALGVDYSIFLMARFREETIAGLNTKEALTKAMTSTGGVIISAAFIMSGTFAALMSSGVVTLLQLGAGIVIGLMLYSNVVLGILVPAAAKLLGKANWWPGRAESRESEQSA